MEKTIFESIKHINNHGKEFWKARELYKVLEYTEYGKFIPVINKAKKACENSGQSQDENFAYMSEMVDIGSNSLREFPSFEFSRYALKT